MKKLFVSFILLFVISILSISCNPKSSDDIRIGAIFPLSGKFSAMGEPLKYATEIAVEEINAKGGINGKKINVIFEDSKGEPKEGVTKVQKLIDIDRVKIITSFLTGVCEAIKPVTENSNTLFVAQTVAPRIHLDAKNTIRFHYSFTEEGKKVSEFLISKNPSVAGFIYSNDPSTSYQIDSIILPSLAAKNIKIVKENFSVGNKEFSAIIQKIKTANCQVIYMAGYGNDMPALLTELNTLGLNSGNITLCGNIGFIELPSDTPYDLYKNVVFTTPPFLLSSNITNYQSFIKKYKEKSGKEQIGYAAYYAYDMIYILSESIKNTSNPEDISSIRKNIAGNFTGLGGPYLITQSGDVQPVVTLGKYQNNQIIEVK